MARRRQRYSRTLLRNKTEPVDTIKLPCYVGTVVQINENFEDRINHPKDNLCNWIITNVNIAINRLNQVRTTYRACRLVGDRVLAIQCDFAVEELGKYVFVYELKYIETPKIKAKEYTINQSIHYFNEKLGEKCTSTIKNKVELIVVKCLVNNEIVKGLLLHNVADTEGVDDCVTISYNSLPENDMKAHNVINLATWFVAETNNYGYYVLNTLAENKLGDIYENTEAKEELNDNK